MIEGRKVDKADEAEINKLLALIKEGEYDEARVMIDAILSEYPECGEAYLGLVMIELGLREYDELFYDHMPSMSNENFRRLLMYADGEIKEYLDDIIGYGEQTLERNGIELRDLGDAYEITGVKEELYFPYINLPVNHKDKPIGKIGYKAFCKNTFIESIELPFTVTAIGDDAFAECTRLESVFSDKLISIGKSAFFGCTALAKFTIPESVKSIGAYAFANCTALTEIELPPSIEFIDSSTFFCCKRLTRVKFSDSLREIGTLAFAGCEKIEEIRLPKNVTKIGASSFLDCKGLKGVIIPKSVKEIHHTAFEKCEGVMILYEGSREEFEKIVTRESVTVSNSYLYSEDGVLLFGKGKEIPVYFYSERSKLFSKNLWHYVDGEPKLW